MLKRKKEHNILILLSCFLLLIIFYSKPIYATEKESKVTFILHKKINKQTTFEPTFSVYDATDFVTENTKSKSIETLKKEVLNTKPEMIRKRMPNKLATIESSEKTDEELLFNFEWTVSENKQQAILFLENGEEKQTELSAPVLITLPVEISQNNDDLLEKIHIYLKTYDYQYKPDVPKEPIIVPPRPFLPQTGEIKTVMVYLGIGLVGVASLIWIKKQRKNLEEM